jgi:hypothetical protein
MNPMKRVGYVALLVVLAVLFAASPALAGKVALRPVSTTYELAPPVDADAPEPQASGTWTLDSYGGGLQEDVTVSCRRLTPGEQYTVVSLVEWTSRYGVWGVGWIVNSGSYLEEHPVTADRKGRLNAQFFVYSEQWWTGGWEGGWYDTLTRHVADVWIVNATTGEVVLETQP